MYGLDGNKKTSNAYRSNVRSYFLVKRSPERLPSPPGGHTLESVTQTHLQAMLLAAVAQQCCRLQAQTADGRVVVFVLQE